MYWNKRNPNDPIEFAGLKLKNENNPRVSIVIFEFDRSTNSTVTTVEKNFPKDN